MRLDLVKREKCLKQVPAGLYKATLQQPIMGRIHARTKGQIRQHEVRPPRQFGIEHLGEAVFRDDLDKSVLQLGDLLTHEGPALHAQQEAAVIFGAERTYFVPNGTSTSNKIALSALLAEGMWFCSTATTTRQSITARCC